MKILFRERKKTLYVLMDIQDSPYGSLREFHRACRVLGEIDTGYHFFVNPQGEIETDRDIKAIAGHKLPANDVSIAIHIQSPKGAITDSQEFTVGNLIANLKRNYKGIQIITRKE